MYKAMRACEDAGNEDSAKSIHKLLAPDKRNGSATEDDEGESVEEADDDDEEKDTEEGSGVEGPGEPGEQNEGPDGGRGKGAKESKQRNKHLAKGEIMLNEARALAMCKAMELEATANLMEALQGASFDQAMAMLAEIKSYRKRPGSSVPRSTNLRESAGPMPDGDKNLKAWCDSLRG